MKPFQLEIITPERTVLRAEVGSIVAPATTGKIGVLANHAPLVASLDAGPLKVTLLDGTTRLFAIGGGFLEVASNEARILADSGEPADEIDEERARKAEERARKRLKDHEKDLDLARAEAALARAVTRLKAVRDLRGYGMGGARERHQAGSGPGH
jgi:F-type H+-transporting ATPase subunit epsilon